MKIGLGTAQFGLDYGITNVNGKVPCSEVKRILIYAEEKGIDLLDTAISYGDSEITLGNIISDTNYFKIVTKVPKLNSINESLDQVIVKSLKNLGQSSLYSVLVHSADDLVGEFGDFIWERLTYFKNVGLVKKIGVSVYSGRQIDLILDKYSIDVIQLPISVVDQRLLLSGHLYKLKSLGVEIHARSIFLQGLIFMDDVNVPDWASRYLKMYKKFLHKNSITSLYAALNFVNNLDEVDKIIVGVCSKEHLVQITETLSEIRVNSINYSDVACFDEEIVNPTMWPIR